MSYIYSVWLLLDHGQPGRNTNLARGELKLISLFPAIFQNQPVTEANEAKGSSYS